MFKILYFKLDQKYLMSTSASGITFLCRNNKTAGAIMQNMSMVELYRFVNVEVWPSKERVLNTLSPLFQGLESPVHMSKSDESKKGS